MRKSMLKRIVIILLALAVIVAIPLIVAYTPRTPIKAAYGTPERIEVRNGNNGKSCVITDPEVLEWITDAFCGDVFHRSRGSFGMGWSYKLTFVFGEEGRTTFILCSPEEIKIGYTRYVPVSGETYSQVFDYLSELTGFPPDKYEAE